MSYILDALKKSEQARGRKKGRGLFEQPPDAPVFYPQPKGSRIRAYFIAAILFINVGFFVLWTRPWQWGGNRSEVKIASAVPAVTGQQTRDQVQDQAVENKISGKDRQATQGLKDEPAPTDKAPAAPGPAAPRVAGGVQIAITKPDVSKAPKNPKAAGTKKELKSATLPGERKNPPAHPEQPARQAAGGGIISDMQPISELGASSEKPVAVPRLHELAPQVLEAIPKISVSMLVYSKKPEERWININGSKRREGDEISAGLKVEEITQEGAILTYQGRRFYKSVIGD